MASPSPVTMPAFDLINSAECVARVSTTVLGQVAGLTPRATVPVEKIPRVGDNAKKTVYKPGEFSLDLRLYAPHDMIEVALILGITQTGGEWLGTEVIQLNSAQAAFDLLVDLYDGVSASDSLLGTFTFDNFKPTNFELPLEGDANPIATLSGECDVWSYTPVATA